MSKLTPSYRDPAEEPRGLILPWRWQAAVGAAFHGAGAAGYAWFFRSFNDSSRYPIIYFSECLIATYIPVVGLCFFLLDDRWRWRALVLGASATLLAGVVGLLMLLAGGLAV